MDDEFASEVTRDSTFSLRNTTPSSNLPIVWEFLPSPRRSDRVRIKSRTLTAPDKLKTNSTAKSLKYNILIVSPTWTTF